MKQSSNVLPSSELVHETLDLLHHQIEKITGELSICEDGTVIEIARAFVALREVKDRLEEQYKIVNKSYEVWKNERLPSRFDADGVPTVNLDEGFRITVSHKVFAGIKKDQKEAAYRWLRENNLEDIITDTVNSSTLSAVAKTMMEENRELDAEYFNVHVIPTTSVTRTK